MKYMIEGDSSRHWSGQKRFEPVSGTILSIKRVKQEQQFLSLLQPTTNAYLFFFSKNKKEY